MPPRSSSKSRGASKSAAAAAAAAPASPTTLVAATSPKLAAGGELRAGRKKQHAVPVPPATLTMREIHAQIPAPYFQRHMWKGFLYVARDLAQSAATVAAMVYGGLPLIEAAEAALPAPAAWAAKAAVWMLFWFVQGLNWTGLWVLAHECGHQAFSASRAVNDAVGLVLHSALLVPYHSWRISHGNHHKNTNHLTKDTVFVPAKRETLVDHARESPIVSVFFMIVTFTVGWPAYLFANVASQNYGRRANHFEPSSPLFRPDERADVIVSDVGIAAMLTALVAASLQFGALNVFLWYGAPYMWVNFWLIFITYLQHTDVRVPHYAPEDWTFVRGALATVDRDFGAALNWWLHHINDSHVVHHIFSQMPFYHAIEVTRKHLPAILGPLYLRDARPLRAALWESWLECRYVIPTEGVAVYHE